MPASAGPNTLGESNLVFAYDTGDVRNSYIGEPTVNLLYSDGATNLINGGGDIYGRCTKTDLENGKFRFVNNGTGVSTVRLYANQPDLINGATYNCSVYFENLIGGLSIDWCDVGITGLNYSTATSGKLEGYSSRGSYAAPYYFLDINFDAGGAVTLYDPQVELKSHTTPFVAGTRSATQGLLPVIGNSTIDLSNVSFDSNAKMVFDGTNDYVDCGAIQPFDLSARNVTWEAIVKFNDTSGVEAVITRWDNTTGMVWWVGRYPTTKMHVAFIINGSYYDYYSNGDIGTTAGYHHIVATLNNTVLTYYINGVLDSTDTVTAGTWTSDPDPSLIIGAQNQGAAANINGEIPVAKIYNRALTAQEVKQNYQQYKTRFNLS